MRKLITLVMVMALLGNAKAQFMKIGPKVGANLQKIDGQSFKNSYQLGYYAGLFAELNLGQKWQLQPELLFNETRFDQSSNFRDIYRNILSVDSASKIKLSQVSIPILINYKIANVLALQVGPQFAINLDKNKSLLRNTGDAFSSGDFAMVGGVKIMISKFRISGRYVIGLNNINDIDKQDSWKSQTVQLGVGFVF